MRVRIVLSFVLGAGLGLGAACDEDSVCSPNTSAMSGDNCMMQSGECFAHNYRMECARSATGGGYECACFLDGISSGTCTMVDICDAGGVFFEHGGSDSSERLYVRMETCCGFDVPY